MSPERSLTPLSLTSDVASRDFGGWLLGELAASGLSQRQLAERSGLHHSTVSRLLRAKREPSYATVLKLAGGLGLGEGESGARRLTPMARVERALRSDVCLQRADIIRVMQVYANVRQPRTPGPENEWRRMVRHDVARQASARPGAAGGSNLRLIARNGSRGPHVRHADLALSGQARGGDRSA
jgi:transcriptional regulator with XRE-family HTH domain